MGFRSKRWSPNSLGWWRDKPERVRDSGTLSTPTSRDPSWEGMPCRKRCPEATTGGRAFLYLPGTDYQVPARDRSRRLSFGLGPRLHSTRGIAGWEAESRGRPTETRCCCSSCAGCSCCEFHSGRCSDCCSTTRHATHGLLLTCPCVQGVEPVTPWEWIGAIRPADIQPR